MITINIREEYEKQEACRLSKYAVLSVHTKGRVKESEKCSIRTEFQKDRDRIIHSKAFRRLKHKTQVFLNPEGDHYRTRMTHTLEVSQIARTIARALNLNEDLTEAISLGHDLGHTPFGHVGEKVLSSVSGILFKHNEQSLRVVDILERPGGLNLTYEVRDGILSHTGDKQPETLEGAVVRFADKISYINHDIDDAIRARILDIKDIPVMYLKTLGETHSARINTMIRDIIKESMDNEKISMSDEIYQNMMGLRQFMFERVYVNSEPKQEESKAVKLMECLYRYFINNTDKLPDELLKIGNGNERAVCDYIAGMTDNFAIRKFNEFFVPRSWEN